MSAETDGDRIRAVTFNSEGQRLTVIADWFLDATELGDLLPLVGCEFITGDENGSPANSQAFSWCFAMEHDDDADNHITRPEQYTYWRDYIPRLTPPWPGPLFSWTTPNPRTMQPNHYRFEPHKEQPKVFSGLWSYRRLIDRSQFEAGAYSSDVCLVNWPMIDYLEGDLCTATAQQREQYLSEAREMSLCLVLLASDGCASSGWRLRMAGTSAFRGSSRHN